jgi:tRNA pseudouridine55 synthase
MMEDHPNKKIKLTHDSDECAKVVQEEPMKIENNPLDGVFLVHKPIGMTPLQAIQKFKKKRADLAKAKMSYAGRLDPMARGLLILLSGNEVKNQKQMELCLKEYVFEVVFGIQTDTYDLLGVTNIGNDIPEIPIIDEQKLRNQLELQIPSHLGHHMQPYPPYSSARVDGKPLFQWAKEGR